MGCPNRLAGAAVCEPLCAPTLGLPEPFLDQARSDSVVQGHRKVGNPPDYLMRSWLLLDSQGINL